MAEARSPKNLAEAMQGASAHGATDVEVVVMPAPATTDPRLVVAEAPQSQAAGSFRALRQRVVDSPERRTFLVTSTGPGEGKSVTAANLALALSELGRARVVLVDAHPAAPMVATLFKVPEPPTWTVTLQARRGADVAPPWEVVRQGDADVHLLTACREPAVPAPLASDYAHLLALLRRTFDFVVVDGPALSARPDAAVLAETVDGVIVVASAGRTRARALRQALEQIPANRLLGTVVLES